MSLTFTENSFSLPILLPKKKRTALKRLVINRPGENGDDFFFGKGGGGWVTWVLGGMEKDQSSSTYYKEGTVEN